MRISKSKMASAKHVADAASAARRSGELTHKA
jgi:hypothetical protein